jgi:hypothetical protein
MSQKLTLARVWLLGLAGLIFPCSAQSAEQARIPYSLVCQIQRSQAKVSQTYTNLQIVLRMRSLTPEIAPEDLRVYIDSKSGPIPVKLDADGNFSVPLRDSLVNENPWIVVNQPKGTMKLEWNVGVIGVRPISGMRYRDLMRPLEEVQSVGREIARGGSKLTVLGLKLIFPKEKQATIVIRARQGDRVFKTDPNHALVIPLEPALLDENPEIAMPDAQERIAVATRVTED